MSSWRARSLTKYVLGFSCTLTTAVSISQARADLDSDATELVRAWSQHGATARLSPRLLERGDLLPVPLPRWATNPNTESCARIALIGTRNANFVARFQPRRHQSDWYSREWPEVSTAGALELTRCGRNKSALGRLLIEMRSPRGILEFIAVEAAAPPPGLLAILPARDPGPTLTSGTSGPRPARHRSLSAQERWNSD